MSKHWDMPVFDTSEAEKVEDRVRKQWRGQEAKSSRTKGGVGATPKALSWHLNEVGDVVIHAYAASNRIRLDREAPFLIGVYTPDVPDGRIAEDVAALRYSEVDAKS